MGKIYMITIIVGPVKAGKSKFLIDKYEEFTSMGEGTQVFSSKFSLNQGETIQSRYGTSLKAIPIDTLFDINCHLKEDTRNILIDEFQFLQMDKKDIKLFFNKNYLKYDFFIFGLDLDYQKNSFPLIGEIICLGDILLKLHSNCDICNNFNVGKYSLRLENGEPANIYNDGQIILLDGEYGDIDIEYRSACEKCWREIYE